MYHLVWGWELTLCKRRPPLGEVPAGKLAPGEVPGRAPADSGCVRLHRAIFSTLEMIHVDTGLEAQCCNWLRKEQPDT